MKALYCEPISSNFIFIRNNLFINKSLFPSGSTPRQNHGNYTCHVKTSTFHRNIFTEILCHSLLNLNNLYYLKNFEILINDGSTSNQLNVVVENFRILEIHRIEDDFSCDRDLEFDDL